MKSLTTNGVIVSIVSVLSGPVLATDLIWSAGCGLWNDVGFWSPVALPGGSTVNDRVFVTNNLLIETITITQTTGAESITLSDGGFSSKC